MRDRERWWEGKRGPDLRGLVLAQELAEDIDGVLAALPAGSPEGHQDRLSVGANPGAIAAPDFPQDHAEAHRLFRSPVGGVQAGMFEEGEQVVAMIPQVLGEGVVGGMGLLRVDGVEQLRMKSAAADGEAVQAEFAVEIAIAKIESVVQKFADAAREHDGRRWRFRGVRRSAARDG